MMLGNSKSHLNTWWQIFTEGWDTVFMDKMPPFSIAATSDITDITPLVSADNGGDRYLWRLGNGRRVLYSARKEE